MPPWPIIASTRYLPSTTAPTLIDDPPLPPATTVGVNVWRRPGRRSWPTRVRRPACAAATGRAPRPSAPRCRAAARDLPACTVLPIASGRARSGRRTAADRCRRRRSARAAPRSSPPATRDPTGGTRATGDCSSSRNTSSGLSDQRSSVITPLSPAQRRRVDAQRRDRLERRRRIRCRAAIRCEHRDALGMQRRVDLRHDHRDQVARIGFVRHAAGQRHQDLARVVLVAEEALIEPPLRARRDTCRPRPSIARKNR